MVQAHSPLPGILPSPHVTLNTLHFHFAIHEVDELNETASSQVTYRELCQHVDDAGGAHGDHETGMPLSMFHQWAVWLPDLGALVVHFNAVHPFKRELLCAVAQTKLEFKIRVFVQQ